MNYRLLIVDDDSNLLSVLERFFSDGANTVVTCSNGVEAIKKCKLEPFDLVITDIMMPGMNGLEVLREIRKIDPGILVILITGFASLETAIGAIREGAYDYITKPFRLEEIKIAVQNALDKIGLVRENQNLLHELQNAYEELRLAKSMTGSKEKPGAESGECRNSEKKTFIADSMLPIHYLTNPRPYSLISDLERISRLRDNGFISDREFELCKSRLLQPLK
jgi:CheY-like chemotaxis protein